jgi:hypothetical protein
MSLAPAPDDIVRSHASPPGRVAAILDYKRALAGSTDDPFLKSFGAGVVELARQAVEVSEHGF